MGTKPKLILDLEFRLSLTITNFRQNIEGEIEYLDLSNNHLADITVLEELTHLKEINLSQNKLANISSLSKLENLNKLYVL